MTHAPHRQAPVLTAWCWLCSMPSATQFTYFAAFLGGGLLALAMAVFVFLPVIIIAPAKFASAFTLGSTLIMSSFFALKGFKAQLAHMLDKDRLLFSIGVPCFSRPDRDVPVPKPGAITDYFFHEIFQCAIHFYFSTMQVHIVIFDR